MELIILMLAGLIGLVPALIASGKGYSFLGWWIYGAALFIVALPHSLMLKPNERGEERAALAAGKRRCPHCAEYIHTTALQCRFCGNPVGRALRALQEGVTLEEVNAEIERKTQPLRLSRGHYPKKRRAQ